MKRNGIRATLVPSSNPHYQMVVVNGTVDPIEAMRRLSIWDGPEFDTPMDAYQSIFRQRHDWEGEGLIRPHRVREFGEFVNGMVGSAEPGHWRWWPSGWLEKHPIGVHERGIFPGVLFHYPR